MGGLDKERWLLSGSDSVGLALRKRSCEVAARIYYRWRFRLLLETHSTCFWWHFFWTQGNLSFCWSTLSSRLLILWNYCWWWFIWLLISNALIRRSWLFWPFSWADCTCRNWNWSLLLLLLWRLGNSHIAWWRLVREGCVCRPLMHGLHPAWREFLLQSHNLLVRYLITDVWRITHLMSSVWGLVIRIEWSTVTLLCRWLPLTLI